MIRLLLLLATVLLPSTAFSNDPNDTHLTPRSKKALGATLAISSQIPKFAGFALMFREILDSSNYSDNELVLGTTMLAAGQIMAFPGWGLAFGGIRATQNIDNAKRQRLEIRSRKAWRAGISLTTISAAMLLGGIVEAYAGRADNILEITQWYSPFTLVAGAWTMTPAIATRRWLRSSGNDAARIEIAPRLLVARGKLVPGVSVTF